MSGEAGWMDNRESYRLGVRKGVLKGLLWEGFWIAVFVIPASVAEGALRLDWLIGPYGIPFWVAIVVIFVVLALTGTSVSTARRVRVDETAVQIDRRRQKRAFPLKGLAEAVFFERAIQRTMIWKSRVPAYIVYLVYRPSWTISLGPIDSPIAEALMAEVARAGGTVKVFSMGTLVSDRPLRGATPIPNS